MKSDKAGYTGDQYALVFKFHPIIPLGLRVQRRKNLLHWFDLSY